MLVYQRVAIKVWTHCRSSALKVWCTFRGRNWNTFSGKTFKAMPTCRLYNGIRHFLKIMKHRWKKFRTAWLLFCFGHVWSNIWPLPMCDIGWKIRYNKHFLKSKDSSDLWCCISWPSEVFGVIPSGKCCSKNGNVLSSIGTTGFISLSDWIFARKYIQYNIYIYTIVYISLLRWIFNSWGGINIHHFQQLVLPIWR